MFNMTAKIDDMCHTVCIEIMNPHDLLICDPLICDALNTDAIM